LRRAKADSEKRSYSGQSAHNPNCQFGMQTPVNAKISQEVDLYRHAVNIVNILETVRIPALLSA
jgi:hypothetical protein